MSGNDSGNDNNETAYKRPRYTATISNTADEMSAVSDRDDENGPGAGPVSSMQNAQVYGHTTAPAGSIVPQIATAVRTEDRTVAHTEEDQLCWMCLYQTDEEAKRMMEFIVKSVGYIDTYNIACQVAAYIRARFQEATDANGDAVPLRGASPEDVDRHIRRHILHPKVRIAVIMKELLDFQEHLRENLVVQDNATGLTCVDKGNVDLYLKVISQITTLYKAETTSMLFGTDES